MNVYDFYLPGLTPDPAENTITMADIGEFKALAMRLCGGWTEGYPIVHARADGLGGCPWVASVVPVSVASDGRGPVTELINAYFTLFPQQPSLTLRSGAGVETIARPL